MRRWLATAAPAHSLFPTRKTTMKLSLRTGAAAALLALTLAGCSAAPETGDEAQGQTQGQSGGEITRDGSEVVIEVAALISDFNNHLMKLSEVASGNLDVVFGELDAIFGGPLPETIEELNELDEAKLDEALHVLNTASAAGAFFDMSRASKAEELLVHVRTLMLAATFEQWPVGTTFEYLPENVTIDAATGRALVDFASGTRIAPDGAREQFDEAEAGSHIYAVTFDEAGRGAIDALAFIGMTN